MVARALLDSGSSLSILSTKAMRTLQLKNLGSSVTIQGVGASSTGTSYPLCSITLSSSDKDDWRQDITAAVMSKVTADLPLQGATSVRELPHLKDLHLADQLFDQPATIDLLLGQDIWKELFLPGEVSGPPGTPAAWHTVFGWVIMGKYTPDQPTNSNNLNLTSQAASTTQVQQNSDDILAKFWELEEPPTMEQTFTPEEQRVESHYQTTHKYLPDQQRYMVSLPKVVARLQLGDSRAQAVNRAKANEKSLIRKGSYSAFLTVIKETREGPVRKQVSSAELLQPASSCYYMPVHAVYKASSSSTKVRAVFDASAKTTTQISLNDTLAVGPTIQPTLDQTLLRFRKYPVAISGDISKMYQEVLLCPEDKSLHRFIWRENSTLPWQDYQMVRVTFRVAASPYLAVKTLQQASRDFGSSLPKASYHIEHSFYVDDFFGRADTPSEAITLQADVRAILSKAGFQLKKWRSSSKQVLSKIPNDILEPLPTQDLVDLHSASYPKALGLVWDSRKDTMATHVELPTHYSSTKRGVVSDIALTFDVLGWLSPTILPMKLLYRQL